MVEQKTSASILSVSEAGFSFGETLIFSQVSLNLSKGETLCLLGPNGCGKTTLIDCILGIHQLDAGEILLNHQPVSRLSPREIARGMAYVPQNHSRHFSFSVLDILLMGRTPYTKFYSSPQASDIRLAEELLEFLGLFHLKERDYTRLSGGETQLVMIMRALIQETPVVVLDEPTAHLDFKNELIVLETIARLIKERELTVIMATHFPNHAFYLENAGIPVEVAFMNSHRVHLAGSPSEALTVKNLEAFYGVRASVISHDLPGKGTLKQIVPIKTLEN